MIYCRSGMLEWLQKSNHMARLGTFHTMCGSSVQFNGATYNSQVCPMSQTKRKIGVSENGRPTRQKMHGSSSTHLLRSQYVLTNLDKRKTIRPHTLCCPLYMFLQLCCPYRNYQYNRC